jgi:hypothetical protein
MSERDPGGWREKTAGKEWIKQPWGRMPAGGPEFEGGMTVKWPFWGAGRGPIWEGLAGEDRGE